VDQLNQILYVLGTPDDGTLNRIGSERVNTLYIYTYTYIYSATILTIMDDYIGSNIY
jgi:hypothetical protein